MNDIKLKILNILRVSFSEVTYYPKTDNDYNNTKYFLVYLFKTPVIDPRTGLSTQMLEIQFPSINHLQNYINELDTLSNSDLLIPNMTSTTPQINNNINVDTKVLRKQDLNITFTGQNTFFVSENLLALDTLVFINGHKLKYVHDYYLTNNSVVFTNSDMLLSPSDTAEIYYLA